MTTYEPSPEEDDPTAIAPEEEPVEEPGDEDVPEQDVMAPEQAAADETVDDTEHEPEGD